MRLAPNRTRWGRRRLPLLGRRKVVTHAGESLLGDAPRQLGFDVAVPYPAGTVKLTSSVPADDSSKTVTEACLSMLNAT